MKNNKGSIVHVYVGEGQGADIMSSMFGMFLALPKTKSHTHTHTNELISAQAEHSHIYSRKRHCSHWPTLTMKTERGHCSNEVENEEKSTPLHCTSLEQICYVTINTSTVPTPNAIPKKHISVMWYEGARRHD